MAFSKKDMNFVHYRWAAHPPAPGGFHNGELSRNYFDPFNGDQVLFMINYCGSISGKMTLKEARGIEDLIAYHLPNEIVSERVVFNWITQQLRKQVPMMLEAV